MFLDEQRGDQKARKYKEKIDTEKPATSKRDIDVVCDDTKDSDRPQAV